MAKSKFRSLRRSTSKAKATSRPAAQADVLERIASALERLSPQRKALPDLSAADAFVWYPDGRLAPVPR
ncbi:MAG: AAA family ATPase, partial [Pseudolabrys sp.]